MSWRGDNDGSRDRNEARKTLLRVELVLMVFGDSVGSNETH